MQATVNLLFVVVLVSTGLFSGGCALQDQFARLGNPTQNAGTQSSVLRAVVDGDFQIGLGAGENVYRLASHGDTIYAAGAFQQYNGAAANYVVRLKTDGSIDSSFQYGLGLNANVYWILPTNDKKLYIGGGFSSYNGIVRNRLVRVNEDGTVDTSFVMGSGILGGHAVRTIQFAPDNSGDIYVGGNFTQYNGAPANGLVRINSDGTHDTTFNTGTGFFGENWVEVIVPTRDASGDIYVAGKFTQYNGQPATRIIRLNSNGSIDSTFNTGEGFNGNVWSGMLAPDSSGDVYFGGTFTRYNQIVSNYFVRLKPNGQIQETFHMGEGFDGSVNVISVIANSKDIYVGGHFANYDGIKARHLLRLSDAGKMNTQYVTGDGFDASIWAITVLESGKMYMGGAFTQFDGSPMLRILRLKWVEQLI